MMSSPVDPSLLPDFSSLRTKVSWDYSLQNYIETRGNFELAVAFAELFWPTFIERNGCVIRAAGYSEENFERWWTVKNGDVRAVECVLNLLHIEDLIPSDTTQLDRAVYSYLGQTVAQTWSARVRALYPDRAFTVKCDEPEDTGPTVYIYQEG